MIASVQDVMPMKTSNISKEKNMADQMGRTAQGLIEKAVAYDERGVGHVAQKDYYDIMAALGVPKELLDAKVKADQEFYNGLYYVGAEEAIKRAKEAKKKGEDPMAQTVTLNVKVPKGSDKLTVNAARTFMASSAVGDTSAPREKIVKTLVTRLDLKRTPMFDKGGMRTMEEEMQKIIGK